MKKHWLAWVPAFGWYFAEKHNPLVVLYEPWILFQIVSTVVMTALTIIVPILLT